jgi:hypothetical protein
MQTIHPAIPEIAGVQVPTFSSGQQVRAEGLKNQAVEAATELVLTSKDEITISNDQDQDFGR